MFRRILLAAGVAVASASAASADDFVWLSQSDAFTQSDRDAFYSRDQGSNMIPYAWLKALRHQDGAGFLSDQLGRYGYLANPQRSDGLPVGFTTLDASGPTTVGMTCAACHTRQIVVESKSYRIDGGPALVDFQRLLTDLDAAVAGVLANDAAFQAFATDVKAIDPSTDPAALRPRVETWYKSFDAIVAASITKAPNHVDWGYGRLDAISMILNRVTGLDIGDGGDAIVPENMHGADAPARYPFLWNATTEKKTQWPGFAPNDPVGGALGRNVGEVMGVFARFDPQKYYFPIQPYKSNSLNFDGLVRLELTLDSIPAPKWPWALDDTKAERGKAVYVSVCKDCHGIEPGGHVAQRDTPVKDVCTDSAEVNLLGRHIVKAGVLKGAATYNLRPSTLDDDALEVDVLKSAVVGSIIQHITFPLSGIGATPDLDAFVQSALRDAARNDPNAPSVALASVLVAKAMRATPPGFSQLQNVYSAPADADPTVCAKRKPTDAPAAYEARYLGGVWAVAPYLHDGGVATLKDLLKPAAERRPSFKIGPNYDVDEVGLAADQPDERSSTLTTTDCSDLASGRSRCGHEYGVDLTAQQKDDLLEFLKKL